MDFVIIFMLMATAAPFLFFYFRKKWLGGLQIIFLVGMWGYFFTTFTAHVAGTFSLFWMAFWASMIVSEIAYIMLVIHIINELKHMKESSDH